MYATANVEIASLTGAALDYCVARALGQRPSLLVYERDGKFSNAHSYSTNWNRGGPLIEKHGMDIIMSSGSSVDKYRAFSSYAVATGPTILIAAMRCLAISILGVHSFDVPVVLNPTLLTKE